MIFDWYKIFNLQAFIDTGLISRTITVFMEDLGERSILVTNAGEGVSVLFDDTFMTIGFGDKNPYVRAPYAVYLDDAGDVWIGIEVQS